MQTATMTSTDSLKPAPSAGLLAALKGLLETAESHMDGDLDAARDTLARASALIRVEREQGRPGETGEGARGLSRWQVRKVVEYIETNLERRIQIDDLTALARLSSRYFASSFKRSFGLPPHAYLIRRRVERAQELMLTTDMPLSEVSLACGLSDQPHLTRLFSRIVGETPAQWRRERRLAA